MACALPRRRWRGRRVEWDSHHPPLHPPTHPHRSPDTRLLALTSRSVPQVTERWLLNLHVHVSGQRIANYSVDFQLKGSEVWLPLVPVLIPNTTASDSAAARSSGQQLTDRPDGHDPRDQCVPRPPKLTRCSAARR